MLERVRELIRAGRRRAPIPPAASLVVYGGTCSCPGDRTCARVYGRQADGVCALYRDRDLPPVEERYLDVVPPRR